MEITAVVQKGNPIAPVRVRWLRSSLAETDASNTASGAPYRRPENIVVMIGDANLNRCCFEGAALFGGQASYYAVLHPFPFLAGFVFLVDLEDHLGDPRFARSGSTSLRSPEPLRRLVAYRGNDPCRRSSNRNDRRPSRVRP
jgi:hypothetical protein